MSKGCENNKDLITTITVTSACRREETFTEERTAEQTRLPTRAQASPRKRAKAAAVPLPRRIARKPQPAHSAPQRCTTTSDSTCSISAPEQPCFVQTGVIYTYLDFIPWLYSGFAFFYFIFFLNGTQSSVALSPACTRASSERTARRLSDLPKEAGHSFEKPWLKARKPNPAVRVLK